jgi:hypothetical protein
MPESLRENADIRRMLEVLAGWVGYDAEASAAWIMELPDADWPEGRAKNDALHRFVLDWTRMDPDAVENWLTTLPAGRSRDLAISRFLAGMLERGMDQTDPSGLASWCGKIGHPSQRGNAIAAVAGAWFAEDLEAAAAWINGMPPSEETDMAMNRLAHVLAGESPGHAMAWALAVRDPSLRKSAVATAVREWTKRDPAEASALLDDLPDDRTRDEALRVFCGELSRNEPALAMEWAETIEDMAQRQTTMITVASSWIRRDAAAARRWLEQSSLPPWAKETVLKEASGR